MSSGLTGMIPESCLNRLMVSESLWLKLKNNILKTTNPKYDKQHQYLKNNKPKYNKQTHHFKYYKSKIQYIKLKIKKQKTHLANQLEDPNNQLANQLSTS